MIEINFSNDLDELSAKFLEVIDSKKIEPLDPEVVVVQTEGIKKWLSLKIAKTNGICCNVKYSSPKKLIFELLECLGVNFAEKHALERSNLFWLILNILTKNPEDYGQLSAYISDNNEVKLVQIANIISDLYDQYFTYRPCLISEWEKGEGSKKYDDNPDAYWQLTLFRKICEKTGTKSFPTAVLDLLKQPLNIDETKLLKRVNFFAVSVLPPFYIEILNFFAPFLDIYMYLLNPSSDYWYEDIPEIAGDKIAKQAGLDDVKDQYYSVKQNLLADFGKLGKDFFSSLLAKDDSNVNINECFKDIPKAESMLSIIKKDLLLNRDLKDDEKYKIDDNDSSIEIHSCHSPMREVEVLYNRLLNIFEKDSTISPRDILVMTPDISEYAPYIEAVFGTSRGSEKNKKHIPYSISDVNYIDESSLIKIFMDILMLVRGRYTASEIFNIIEFEDIRNKFNLNETDINILRVCMNKSGIRWGLGSSHRKDEGLPHNSEFSWEYGIERLLLSLIYESDELYSNILAIKGIGTPANEAITAVIEFINILQALYLFSCTKHDVSDWYKKLSELVREVFMESSKNSKDFSKLTSILDAMDRSYKSYVSNNQSICVGIDFIIEYLNSSLKNKRQFHRFLDGNLNFCEMIPMRSIPFKIICIVGLNDDTFPRKRKPMTFDLIAQMPEKGDRNLRENDRYLFLETILSAGEKLYLSYTGQDLITNNELPPSTLITQFIYNIGERFIFDCDAKIGDRLINKHPLFSFSEKYFLKDRGDMYINYSEDDYLTVKSKNGDNKNDNFKFAGREIDKKIEDNFINIDDLIIFFGHPIEYFFKRSLGINLYEKDFAVADTEPLNINKDEYNIKKLIIDNFFNKNCNKETDLKVKRYIYKYTGMLPPGGVGSVEIKHAVAHSEKFFNKLKDYIDVTERKTYEISFDFNGYRLEGVLKYFHVFKDVPDTETSADRFEDTNLVYYRPASTKTKDKISTWVKHVIFNYFEIKNKRKPRCTYYIGEKKDKNSNDFILEKLAFKPYKIKEQFKFIMDTYLKGIKKPLHFYPEVSEGYFNGKNYKQLFLGYMKDNQYGYDKKDNYLVFYMKDFAETDEFFNNEFVELSNGLFSNIKDSLAEKQ